MPIAEQGQTGVRIEEVNRTAGIAPRGLYGNRQRGPPAGLTGKIRHPCAQAPKAWALMRRLSDRVSLAQAEASASCLEKYRSAVEVLVCCLPVRSTPRPVSIALDSAATWNAWLGGHLVDSSRIREPSG
jgi:hypothetical protein